MISHPWRGGFRNPDFIVGVDLRDRALCSYPAALDRATGVAWVGDVSSDLYEDLREAEYVSIDVVADDCRLRRLAHAARADVS